MREKVHTCAEHDRENLKFQAKKNKISQVSRQNKPTALCASDAQLEPESCSNSHSSSQNMLFQGVNLVFVGSVPVENKRQTQITGGLHGWRDLLAHQPAEGVSFPAGRPFRSVQPSRVCNCGPADSEMCVDGHSN